MYFCDVGYADAWMQHMWGWPFMGMGGGWFIWVLILILIGIGFYFFFIPRRGMTTQRTDDALDIARRRFARGEISSEEFEKIKKNLEK